MSENLKQVIVMRTDLNMRKGKMVAQGGHASIGALFAYNPSEREFLFAKWTEQGSTKICVGVDSEKALLDLAALCKSKDLPYFLVQDEGRTEFNGVATYTCLGIGPDVSSVIDGITGKLKLL